MENLKQLWDKLAKINSRYYINSDKGKGITEKEFKKSGKEDYLRLISTDSFLIRKGTILEIGCGTGRMTEWMVDVFDKIIGVDISGEMINQAKERLGYWSNVDLIFYETDGKTMPLKDNMIDVAFSYLVFQHMKDKRMVEANFKEVYRVLKKDGVFKVLLRTDEVDLKKWWGGVNYDDKAIKLLCKDTGFSIIKTEKVKNYGVWLWLEK